MKNTLAENMRRFNTKNLREEASTIPATPMYTWVMQMVTKYKMQDKTMHIGSNRDETYVKFSPRGRVALSISDTGDYLNVTVLNGLKEEIYNKDILLSQWTPDQATSIERVIMPHVR